MSYMKYAQDPKFKAPTMTELTSDLALRYMDAEAELTGAPANQLAAHVHLNALGRILYSMTGQREWNSKADAHQLEANRVRSYLNSLAAKNEAGSRNTLAFKEAASG